MVLGCVFPEVPCWLSKRRESFTALGERTLTPLVRDGPTSSAPTHPMAEGCGGRQHWLLPGSCASRGIFISLGFVPPSLTVEYGVVSVCFLFSSRVGKGRTVVWSSCSQPKVRALSCWHQGICGNSAYCTQRGRRTSQETKQELWRVHSLFVCVWFITSVKSFVHCRCLICPCSCHNSFVENNTCIDLITASPAEKQCSVIVQVSSVRVSPLT